MNHNLAKSLSSPWLKGVALCIAAQGAFAQLSNGEITGIGPAPASVKVGQPVTFTVLGKMERNGKGCHLWGGPVGKFQDLGVVTSFPATLPKPLVFDQPGMQMVHVYGGTNDPTYVCTGSKSFSIQVVPNGNGGAAPALGGQISPSSPTPGLATQSIGSAAGAAIPQAPSVMPQNPSLVRAKLTALVVEGLHPLGDGATQVQFNLTADRQVAGCQFTLSATTLYAGGTDTINISVGQADFAWSVPYRGGINFGKYAPGKYRLRAVAKPTPNNTCEGDVSGDFTVTAPPAAAATSPAPANPGAPQTPSAQFQAAPSTTIQPTPQGPKDIKLGGESGGKTGPQLQTVPGVQAADLAAKVGKAIPPTVKGKVNSIDQFFYQASDKSLRYYLNAEVGSEPCGVTVQLRNDAIGLVRNSAHLVGVVTYAGGFVTPNGLGYQPGTYRIIVKPSEQEGRPACAVDEKYSEKEFVLKASDISGQLATLNLNSPLLTPHEIGTGSITPVLFSVDADPYEFGANDPNAKCNASVVITHQESGVNISKKAVFSRGSNTFNVSEIMKSHGGLKTGKYRIQAFASAENYHNGDGKTNNYFNCDGQIERTLTVADTGSSRIEGVIWTVGSPKDGPGYYNNTYRNMTVVLTPIISGTTLCRYAIDFEEENTTFGLYEPGSKKVTAILVSTLYSDQAIPEKKIVVRGAKYDAVPACSQGFEQVVKLKPASQGVN